MTDEKMKMVKIGVAAVALLIAVGLLLNYFGVFGSGTEAAPKGAQQAFTPEEQQQMEQQIEKKKKLEKTKTPAGS